MVIIFSILLIITLISTSYYLYLYAFTSKGHVSKNLYLFIGLLILFILFGAWLLDLL
ncbi:hypothetical protein CO98_1523 [Staphylococcus aureus subsp. aureus CO-98]|nr:hypothetical protein CO98_1523 [Staphylococcus aureus subsp. aureus CO-98]